MTSHIYWQGVELSFSSLIHEFAYCPPAIFMTCLQESTANSRRSVGSSAGARFSFQYETVVNHMLTLKRDFLTGDPTDT